MEYYDLSPEISEKTAVWPGDQKYGQTIAIDFKNGGNLLLSSIKTTLHLGSHADAPNHYHPDGQGIHTRDMNFYFGDCQVIHVSLPKTSRILPSHIAKSEVVTERVLFRTNSFPDPEKWTDDFCSLSPELVDYLAKKNVKLIGIDTPSVDPWNDKELCSHQVIYRNNMAILEGIVLTQVPEGIYHLMALPLKIKDADASPVRAILVKNFNGTKTGNPILRDL